MEYQILRTPQDVTEWIEERKKYDKDFEPDIHNSWLPVYAVWCDCESNGYADIRYDFHSIYDLKRRLNHLTEKLNK